MTDTAGNRLPPRAPLLAWHLSGAVVAAVAALPAAYVALDDVHTGAALAVGVLPAAAVGISPVRRERAMLLAAGPLIGLPMVIGAAVAGSPALALICLCVLAALGGRLASLRPAARLGGLITVLVTPMVAIGLSFDDVESALRVCAMFVLGSAVLWVVSLAVPEGAATARPPAEEFPDTGGSWWPRSPSSPRRSGSH